MLSERIDRLDSALMERVDNLVMVEALKWWEKGRSWFLVGTSYNPSPCTPRTPPILPQIIKEQTLEPSTRNSFLNILNVYNLRVMIHQFDIWTCTAQNCSESLIATFQ